MTNNCPTLAESPPYKEALKQFNDLLECGSDRKKIKQLSTKVGTRSIARYKEFMEVVRTYEGEVGLYEVFGNDSFASRKVTYEQANSIVAAIEKVEETPDREETYTGEFTMIDRDKMKFRFAPNDPEIPGIECTFSDEIPEDVRLSVIHDRKYVVKFVIESKYNPVTDSETQTYIISEIQGEKASS